MDKLENNLRKNVTWNNLTLSPPFEYFREPLPVEVLRLVVEIAIALFGVVGNVLVCLVVTNNKKLHSVVNFHIRNLAIADLGVLLINFPLAVIKEQDPTNWPLGKFFCLYIYPIGDVFHGVSVWSITAIAIDRYRAIVREVRRDRHKALKMARLTVFSLWIISFLIVSLPLFFVMNFIDYRPEHNFIDCTPIWPDQSEKNILRQVYMLGIALFWYIIPLSVIIWTYIKIGQRLKQSSRFHKSFRGVRQAKKRQRREKINSKAKKLLTPVVVVFSVTMFPLNALRLAIIYWKELPYDRYLWVYYNIAVICVTINSSVNCLIYALVSKDFRTNFFRLCKRKAKGFDDIPLSSNSPLTINHTKYERDSMRNTTC